MSQSAEKCSYVLVTPARNEAAYIERTIESVVAQSALPLKWVIVNDGSLDSTGEIVADYARQYSWIEPVTLPKHRDRSFAGKVYAFNAGLERVRGLDYEVIGNIDADISFDSSYCEFLLNEFRNDAGLGVAGTVFEEDGYNSGVDSFEGQAHVAGGCQMFRKQCFEEIGGYVPNRAGGIDWIAVTTARMMGWRTRSFREKKFFHYRRLGTAERRVLASLFSYGEKDYYLGGHPVWEICRVAYRAAKKPYIIGAAALGAGYISALVRQTERPVSDELMRFHRNEQMTKLRVIVNSMLRFRRVDNFDLAAN